MGIGSTFYIEFPKKEVLQTLSDDDVQAIRKEETASLIKPKFESKMKLGGANSLIFTKKNNQLDTILIVEDNSSLREFMVLLLEDQYNILQAENGLEAIESLNLIIKNIEKSTPEIRLPDIIISDIMMPIMDGFQFLEILKKDSNLWRIPVIMLTARLELKAKLKALRIGVDDYMIKPFIEEELINRVANLLTNAAQRKLYWKEMGNKKIQKQLSEEGLMAKVKETGVLNFQDFEWLENLETQVLAHLGDFDFNLNLLSQHVFLSPRQIRRRLKLLTGLTFSEYLQEIRFSLARQLLEKKEVNSIKNLAFSVGMKDVAYFSKQFKKLYGRLPSSYLG